ncbi:hypothetical protein [Candidatus Manganitrophus noduliformans]|uniref:Uncharacterized protein n=1 Tax=Candidatus Manganitrophus noduliformans TaxID=2606439 RepID=A0A7X6IA16_9BACT|nr:hypothetical protein [Candidatus Manganitrophus noduliformans]NKE69894.1 hypothetical protein [Candidatus Manganitrophus noduliformans]
MSGRVTHEIDLEKPLIRGVELTPDAAELNKFNLLTGEKVVKAVTGEINFNVASPFDVSLGVIPKGAIIIETIVNVITVFNAGTTNVLVVGKAGTANELVAEGDVNEASATLQRVAKNIAALAADTEYLANYTQTGGAATTGKARVTIVYLI